MMKNNQTVYTNFYAKANFVAVTSSESWKETYQEDGRLIEEEKIKIKLEDDSEITVELIHIKKYTKESEIPELFYLSVIDRTNIENEEKQIYSDLEKNVLMTIVLLDDNKPPIKRVFKGNILACKAAATKFRDLHNYTGMSTSYSSY